MNTEQELIRLIKENKEKYYRVAFTYVKNTEDALDVVHNAIFKALQKVNSLHKKEYLEYMESMLEKTVIEMEEPPKMA